MERSEKNLIRKLKLLMAVFFIVFLISQCVAEKTSATEKKEEPVISGILMIDSSSMYVDKLSGENIYRGYVMQPSATVVFENLGTYLNITATKVSDGKRLYFPPETGQHAKIDSRIVNLQKYGEYQKTTLGCFQNQGGCGNDQAN